MFYDILPICCPDLLINAADVTLTSLSVTGGPSYGTTLVTLTGTEFLATATCRFGTLMATATTVVTSTRLVCESPAQSVGEVSVEVTNNAQDFTSWLLQFQYYGAHVISLSFSPFLV